VISVFRFWSRSSTWGICYRVLTASGGLILVVLVPLYTTVEEQGLYYSLLALSSLYVIFELGLNAAIINFMSHQLIDGPSGRQRNTRRVCLANQSRLLWFVTKWILAGVVLTAISVFGFGLYAFGNFFSSYPNLVPSLGMVAISTGLSLFFFAALAVMDGYNKMVEAFKYRILYMSAFLLIQFSLLIGGLSFMALALSQLLALLLLLPLVFLRNFTPYKRVLSFTMGPATIDIRNQVLPFQRRVAISWIFGFMPLQMMPIFLLNGLGPEWAGRFGMTQQVLNSLSATAFVFVQTKIPNMGILISKAKMKEAIQLYRQGMKESMLVSFVLITGILAVLWLTTFFGLTVIERLLPLSMFISISIIVMAQSLTFSRATFLRVNHIEVFAPTVLGGIILFLVLGLFSGSIGVWGVIALLVGEKLIVGVFWGGFIFRRYFDVFLARV